MQCIGCGKHLTSETEQMIYPNKHFTTIQSWANGLPNYFPGGQIPTYSDPWESWALSVIKSPIFSGLSAPNPMNYKDWINWAQDFYKVTNYSINGA